MKTLAYSPWGNGRSIKPFDQIFDQSVDARAHGFDNADAFILWGGTDIHPSYYGAKPHRSNQAGANPSDRDVWEWNAMKLCKARGIPIIGVCRGAQFMCAFTGGKLIQHASGHGGGNHNVITSDNEKFMVTTCHHQMLDLRGTNHELLAWTPEPLSKFYQGESTDDVVDKAKFKEPEIVFFPDIKGIAIQGHPEWAPEQSKFVAYCNDKIVELLFNEVWA
jgi:carbamoylphosphate synthase small subunit